jgi:3',5'-cyclic AMP phosphodiesterase CpdA
VRDAGDVLSLLRQCRVDLVLAGHRHVPYVWPVGGMLLVHSGTVSTQRTRGFPHPAYNLVRVENGRIDVQLRIPGGEGRSLGDYPGTGRRRSRLAMPIRSSAHSATSRSPTTRTESRLGVWRRGVRRRSVPAV